MNIDELLLEAEQGKRSPILARITKEALPFGKDVKLKYLTEHR